MATRRKLTADAWQQVSETVEMQNGTQASTWENSNTGEIRVIPSGLHPTDQPLTVAPTYDEPEEYEETATDRVATMLAVAGNSERAELKVYRVAQGQLEYCRGFRPDEFEDGNFDMLRERFGPGVYELRLYATHPENKKFVVRSKTRVTIAADQSTSSNRGGIDSGMAQVLATIAQGQQQMLDALVQIKQAPVKDPMEEMGKMMALMAGMREAMGLNAPQGREKSSIGEIVSAIRELRGAADEIAPPKEEKEDGLMGMLPKMLEIVAAGQQAQQLPAYAPTQFAPVELPQSFATPPQMPPAPEAAPRETPEENEMKMMTMIKLRGYLKSLVDMAKANKPIPESAEWVYDKLPDELIEIMALDNWFELLCAVGGEIKDHKEWTTKVRDAALKLFDDSPED